jgi:hypothetical protein
MDQAPFGKRWRNGTRDVFNTGMFAHVGFADARFQGF